MDVDWEAVASTLLIFGICSILMLTLARVETKARKRRENGTVKSLDNNLSQTLVTDGEACCLFASPSTTGRTGRLQQVGADVLPSGCTREPLCPIGFVTVPAGTVQCGQLGFADVLKSYSAAQFDPVESSAISSCEDLTSSQDSSTAEAQDYAIPLRRVEFGSLASAGTQTEEVATTASPCTVCCWSRPWTRAASPNNRTASSGASCGQPETMSQAAEADSLALDRKRRDYEQSLTLDPGQSRRTDNSEINSSGLHGVGARPKTYINNENSISGDTLSNIQTHSSTVASRNLETVRNRERIADVAEAQRASYENTETFKSDIASLDRRQSSRFRFRSLSQETGHFTASNTVSNTEAEPCVKSTEPPSSGNPRQQMQSPGLTNPCNIHCQLCSPWEVSTCVCTSPQMRAMPAARGAVRNCGVPWGRHMDLSRGHGEGIGAGIRQPPAYIFSPPYYSEEPNQPPAFSYEAISQPVAANPICLDLPPPYSLIDPLATVRSTEILHRVDRPLREPIQQSLWEESFRCRQAETEARCTFYRGCSHERDIPVSASAVALPNAAGLSADNTGQEVVRRLCYSRDELLELNPAAAAQQSSSLPLGEEDRWDDQENGQCQETDTLELEEDTNDGVDNENDLEDDDKKGEEDCCGKKDDEEEGDVEEEVSFLHLRSHHLRPRSLRSHKSENVNKKQSFGDVSSDALSDHSFAAVRQNRERCHGPTRGNNRSNIRRRYVEMTDQAVNNRKASLENVRGPPVRLQTMCLRQETGKDQENTPKLLTISAQQQTNRPSQNTPVLTNVSCVDAEGKFNCQNSEFITINCNYSKDENQSICNTGLRLRHWKTAHPRSSGHVRRAQGRHVMRQLAGSRGRKSMIRMTRHGLCAGSSRSSLARQARPFSFRGAADDDDGKTSLSAASQRFVRRGSKGRGLRTQRLNRLIPDRCRSLCDPSKGFRNNTALVWRVAKVPSTASPEAP